MHRVLPMTAVAALLAGLVAVTTVTVTTVAITTPAATAAPAAGLAAEHRAPSRPSVTDSTRPSWLQSHGAAPTSVPAAVIAKGQLAAPSVPTRGKLDPSAQHGPAANGTVRVRVDGTAGAVASQVRGVGGRVLVAANGQTSAVVPAAQLSTLAASPAVTAVTSAAADRPYEASAPGPSQGVGASAADVWQAAGATGAGVKLAVVDSGFGVNPAEYDAEVAADHLDASTTVINQDCTDSNNSPTAFDGASHGLAVAELVHQEAPDAQLFLYCVFSRTGVASAEADIQSRGITIVSSSLGWPNDGRGDGTGPANSVALTTAKARKAGILWIESAGNDVPFHYGGTLTDRNHDGIIDLGNANENDAPYESDFYTLAGNDGSGPTAASWYLQWDQWPTSDLAVRFAVYGVQCYGAFGSGGFDNCQGQPINPDREDYPTPIVSTHSSGQPTMELDTYSRPNDSQYDQIWQVMIFVGKSVPAVRYDLTGYGDFDGAAGLSCPTSTSAGQCVFAPAAIKGSVSSPANSPYVLAVGAANVGVDEVTKGTLEYFSSQGPTIDGRVKPDITGWDGVSSYVPEFSAGFYGTSAAAPNVAGAAALVSAAATANGTSLDAAQLQSFLEQRANHGLPTNPPTNQTGRGVLTLGASPTTTPVMPDQSNGFAPLATPVRILSTRDGPLKQPAGVMAPDQVLTVPIPSAADLPSTATAVAINLTGAYAAGTTFLSVFPNSYAGTSNLNLSTTEPTAAVAAVVPLGGRSNRYLKVRNDAAKVLATIDLVGYFDPTSAGVNNYGPVSPTRLLPKTTLGMGQTITIHVPDSPAVGSDVRAAVVNVTAAGVSKGGGDLVIYPAGPSVPSTSTLNFAKYHRANLAFVGLDSGGDFTVRNRGTSVGVAIDIEGWFGASAPERFVPLASPVRIADTQTGNGGRLGSVPAGGALRLQGARIFDVPYTAGGLMLGVTAVSSGSGYLTVYGDGAARPATLNLNFDPGRRVPNAVIAPPSSAGVFDTFNSGGSTRVVVDLFGYFQPAPD